MGGGYSPLSPPLGYASGTDSHVLQDEIRLIASTTTRFTTRRDYFIERSPRNVQKFNGVMTLFFFFFFYLI